MQLQAMADDQPMHAQHIQQYCDYADAAASAAASDVQQQLTPEIEKEVSRQMKAGKVAVEVDKASVKRVQKAIDDMFAPLRNWFK